VVAADTAEEAAEVAVSIWEVADISEAVEVAVSTWEAADIPQAAVSR
jgi:hypothetical protein